MIERHEYKISKRCPRAIASKAMYAWDPRAQELGQDKPLKRDDHEADMERYMIHTAAVHGVRLPEDAHGFGDI